MNEYDNWKLATPPDDAECELCGEWVKDWKVFTADGQRYGQVLCHGCYDEMVQAQQDERAAAFASMEDDNQ